MLKNGQIYIKHFAAFTPQDFKIMFGHFSTLCMTGLKAYFHSECLFVIFDIPTFI